MVGVGLAAFVGARELVGQRGLAPRPAEQPDVLGAALPIWPLGMREDIDRIQQLVDEGHQPWYLSPEIVAQVFAMDILSWEREDIEASVRGDEPVQVVISNPALTDAAGVAADIRTILTLERWRNRPDGIFVVTKADTDLVDVDSPTPGQNLEGPDQFEYSGTVSPTGQELFLELRVVHLVLGHEDAPFGLRPLPLIGPSSGTGSSRFGGGAPIDEPLPDWLAFMAFIGDSPDVNPNRLALEAFRVGSGYPIPPERLPAPVTATRHAIQAAANHRSWAAFEGLIDPNRFEFTFGGERDPVAFWKQLESEGTPVRQILATLLSYPGTEYEGLYMWPSAAVKQPKDWTEEDLEPLRLIYTEKELEQMRSFDSYYGWRVGIEPDGDWIFFVAGD